MKKMQICLIAQFPPPMHGLSKAVETLYNSNLSNEFEFIKIDITSNKKILKNLIQIWFCKADLFYLTISQTKGGNLRDLLILQVLGQRKKRSLIHLHGGYYRTLVDNDLPIWQKVLNYKVVNKLAGAIVLSESLKTIFQGMIANQKIFVVHNCVDDQFLISDSEFNEKLERVQSKEVLHVLYLSNFIKTKGYPKVLELAKLEKERCDRGESKQFHFDFAGKFFNEEDRSFFFTYIENNNLQDFVTYHGVVGGQKKLQLLRDSDIFILLTRYPNEGQPISIIEAMGNGMAIVTTDHSGIPDVVKDGINGIVVREKDENSLNIYKSITNLKENINTIMRTNRNECQRLYRERRYLDNMAEIFRILRLRIEEKV